MDHAIPYSRNPTPERLAPPRSGLAGQGKEIPWGRDGTAGRTACPEFFSLPGSASRSLLTDYRFYPLPQFSIRHNPLSAEHEKRTQEVQPII
ncbi:hypothetical protein SBV1_150019 [Verrucomicrobia bacterium]|nr:hypothetical protein SBV1_150019 [Verrucomicrobiota bacterium]